MKKKINDENNAERKLVQLLVKNLNFVWINLPIKESIKFPIKEKITI